MIFLMLRNSLIILLITLNACLENQISPPSTEDFQAASLLLGEIESRGDFINSPEFPAILDAETVFNNFSEFYIIELRSTDDYNNGHLINSIRLDNKQLLEHIKSIDKQKKILLVSNTGQSSAYYTALLRLFGYENIYSLNFGIASWNDDFSIYYRPFLSDEIPRETWTESDSYTNLTYPKDHNNYLPTIRNDYTSVGELLEKRISDLMKQDFSETDFNSIFSLNSISEVLVDFKDTGQNYTICFGNSDLYYVYKPGDPRFPGHPIVSVLYNSSYVNGDLKSTTNLQTIPPDKNIYIYSYSGQRSAMLSAFLKLLGFKSKSILFGGQNMFSSRFEIKDDSTDSPGLLEYGYMNNIKDYPYDK